MREELKKNLERIISQYFNGNRVYDSAYIWAYKHNLLQIATYYHHIAHKKPLNADTFIEYSLSQLGKEDSFTLYEIPLANTSYNSLLEVTKLILSYENQTLLLLESVADMCNESKDSETISKISEIFNIQRKYVSEANKFKNIVETYGNTERDWIFINTEIDDLLDVDDL